MSPIRLCCVFALLVTVALAAAPARSALPAATAEGEPLPSLAPVMERVMPTVVNVATFATVEIRNPLLDDPFFGRFFDLPGNQRRTRRTRSAGSGVIVDAAGGYIVTNAHVVRRADEIAVTLADGRTVAAELVGTDAQVDLAVLEIEPEALAAGRDAEALPQARFADSSRLRVGDFVVAIGNPFGLEQTVTSGIVSAIGRSGLGIEGYEDFIQTDASINPGNSGGALVDLRGDLVGINTAILAPAGGNVGIGFAIPANMVRVIMGELIAHGEVRRGNLGLVVQELNVELARTFDTEARQGVVVTAVEPDSPAAAAGVQVGDVLVRLGERRLRTAADYRARAAVVLVDETVEAELLRDGERRRARLEIGSEDYEKVPGQRLHRALTGARLQNHRDEAGEPAGVRLVGVAAGSPAWRLGLRAGDTVVGIARQPVTNLSDLTEALELEGRRAVLRILREERLYDVLLR